MRKNHKRYIPADMTGLTKVGANTGRVLTPKELDDPYYAYTCVECGKKATNTYCEPERSQMLESRTCFYCNFYIQLDKTLAKDHTSRTIIDGHLYNPGSKTTGEFRGMGGRRFDIEYIEPSVYTGQKITTFDLWSGSTLPQWLRDKYPDTAKFLGAEKVKVGDITCWNPTKYSLEQFKNPSQLVPNKDK